MVQRIADSIETCVQQDPGGRGLAAWACRSELLPATESLYRSCRVLITTGFYILSAGAIETDGPLGAIVLAHALERLGKPVSILVDDHAAAVMRSGLDFIGGDIELMTVVPGVAIDPSMAIRAYTSHVVAIERPGRSANDRHYNMAGKNIDAYVAPVDDLFLHARDMGLVTIGIGDGGNELGMGAVSGRVDAHLSCQPPISCRIVADHCICAGVSNWGGYGIAALLSYFAERNLLPAVDRLMDLLDRIVAAGAVDGILATPCASVDGLAASWERGVYAQVRRIAGFGE